MWLSVILLAGCLGPSADDVGPQSVLGPSVVAAIDPDPWRLDLRGCREGGGVAVYGMAFYELAGHHVPDPWVLADVRDELGDPHWGANGDPTPMGPVTGHWHQAVQCGDAVWNGDTVGPFAYGWVGIRIEPPSWDVGGADRHLLLSGLALPAGPWQDVLAARHVPVTVAARAEVGLAAPAVVTSILDDRTKGVYEAWGSVVPAGAAGGVTRIWMMHAEAGPEGSDGRHRPVWIDWTDEGGQRSVTGESAALGCHTRTPMHGPQGGLCGLAAMWLVDGFDRSMQWGGRAPTALEHGWDH